MKRNKFMLITLSISATYVFVQLLNAGYTRSNTIWRKTAEVIVSSDNMGVDSQLPTTARHLSTHSVNTWIKTGSVLRTEIHPNETVKDKYPTLDDCYRAIQYGEQGKNVTLAAVPDLTSDIDVVNTLERGCDEFTARYRFMSADDEKVFSTEEESSFSIAYTMLVHKDLHQIATLLSAIYRTQHIFCVHADIKSSETFVKGITMMAKCFPNVFRSSKSESVIYASFSRLKAEVNCMKDLLRLPSTLYSWKYLLNLCGQDFPTSTNLEIVNQLKSMEGQICLSGTKELNEIAANRVKYIHIIKNITIDNVTKEVVHQTKNLLDAPPYNLTTAKSMAYGVFTREFLQWALIDSDEGRALFNWTSFTKTPDEHFWATLKTYPESPGPSTLGWTAIARAILWKNTRREHYCKGYWQHMSCVFGGRSLWWLTQIPQLFVNKFDMKYDSFPVQCLRRLIDERTRGNVNDRNPIRKPMGVK